VAATGRLRTGDTPDGNGFFTILEVSGQRNGVAITELQGAGSSIPGNAGYFSDNLVRLGTEPLTKNGFNVSYADGSFSNVFTATFLSPVVDMDFHSVPPNFTVGPDTEREGSSWCARCRCPDRCRPWECAWRWRGVGGCGAAGIGWGSHTTAAEG
jgi:hypothetical protein